MNISERWEKFLVGNLFASAIVLYLQIPHTLTAADCFFNLGMGVIHFHPFLDFLLYSIDLLEVIPMFGVTMNLVVMVRARWKKSK